MKKLQNNFTTPEQSERLLELGVPANSADCYYTIHRDFIWVKSDVDKIDWNAKVGSKNVYLPCWSVGRLIEIFFKSSRYTYVLFYPQFDYLMRLFEEKIRAHKLDFSKLED